MTEYIQVEDVFGRKRFADSVINLIVKTKSPYSIGINAKWGNGKTTFVRQFLSEAAKKNDIPIVIFDCFEHERAGDPLFSITQHILASLTPNTDTPQCKARVLEALKSLAIGTGKVIANTALQTLIKQNLSDFLSNYSEAEIAKTAADNTTKSLEDYLAARLQDGFKEKEVKSQFRNSVEELAALSSPLGKIIVVIDELDRCRPDFALNVLEAIKHILHTTGLVFVLTYHRMQLCHTIEHEFGKGIDSNLYLHKFVNIDLTLPCDQVKESRTWFVKLIDQYIKEFIQNGYSERMHENMAICLHELYVIYDLETRTVERCITIYFVSNVQGKLDESVLLTLIVWCIQKPQLISKFLNTFSLSGEDIDELGFNSLAKSELFSRQLGHNTPSCYDQLDQIMKSTKHDNHRYASYARVILKDILYLT